MGGGFAKLTAVMLQETRAVDLQKFRGGFRVVWAMDLQGPRVEGGRWICKLGRRGSRRRIWKAGGVPWPVLERSLWCWLPGLAVWVVRPREGCRGAWLSGGLGVGLGQ